MAKKFKFKLDGLLKVREFNEKKMKIELGEILKEIGSVEDRILQLKAEIAASYEEEKRVATESNARMLHFFPYYRQGKTDDIRNNESLLFALRRRYDFKVEEMKKARGEVRVVEKLKEKSFDQYKKDRNKQELQDLEEILNMRRKVE